VAVASAEPYASLHLAADRQPCQHPTTQLFTGRMPFLPPNQQRQSTEGKLEQASKFIVSCLLRLERYDTTIRDAILTFTQKLTRVSE